MSNCQAAPIDTLDRRPPITIIAALEAKMDAGTKEGASREGSWRGEASRAIVGLLNTHGLASVSPVPPAYKTRGDVESSAKRPRVPKTAPTTSSIRSNRRPAATWHTVGGNRGGVLSPRRPRVNDEPLQASNLPHYQSTNRASAAKTGTSISHVPAAYMSDQSRSLERGISRAATGASPTTAADAFLGLTLGQNLGRQGGGGITTAAPLSATAAVSPSKVEASSVKSNRSRAPPREPPRKRQQTSVATTKQPYGMAPSSLVAGKMDSAAAGEAEAFPLAPRCEAIGTAAGSSGAEENAAALRASGVQAGSRWPLVPQLSSPRVQAESHPWQLSLDRFAFSDASAVGTGLWRLTEEDDTETADHPADVEKTRGPTPLFPQEERLHSSARPRGQRHRGAATGRDDGFARVPSRLYSEPIRIPTPPAEKSVYGDKILSATSTGFVAPYSGTGSAESILIGNSGERGNTKEEDKPPTPWLRQRRVKSLVETSPSTPVEPLSRGGDVENRVQEKNGQDPHAIPGAIDKQDSCVDVKTETEADAGSWWGQRVYRGGVSDSDDGGEAEGISRDGVGGDGSRSKAVLEEARHSNASSSVGGGGADSPAVAAAGVKRIVLGEAGIGDFCVTRSLGKVALPGSSRGRGGGKNAANNSRKPTEENSAADKEKMPPPTDASTGSDTPSNSNSSQESDDDEDGTEPGNFDKEEKSELRKRRKRKSLVVNSVQATPEEKLEAEDRARRLLKRARRFLRAGRTKRAHAIISRAIALTGQPYMCVVLRELRARMRCTLGRWVGATEDVRAALRALERGAGDARDVRASKETPTEDDAAELGARRWREIACSLVTRHRTRSIPGNFGAIVSAVLMGWRGLRARVMLVAAKVLAQQEKFEAAIECTREVRDLAARRSAQPHGLNGVSGSVLQEAFKLEIKCLQEMGDIGAALQTAQDMDAQAKRTIHELTPQTSTVISDGFGGGGAGDVESDPSVVALVPDAKEVAADLEKAYEAEVWAKVTIATLTTLSIGVGAHANKGDRAGNTGEKKPTTTTTTTTARKKNQPSEAVVPARMNGGLLLAAASQTQAPKKALLPGGYSLRSAAATAAVSSFDTRVNDNDGTDDARNDSTRLRRRRTTTTTAANALIAPPAVAAVAAVDEARAARGSSEEKINKYSSEKRYDHPVTTRLARHRENGVSNDKVEVCLFLEEEHDGADANKTNDETVDDGVDVDDEKHDKTVERARASEVGGGSLLQEGLCLTERPDATVGFVDNLDDKRAKYADADVDAGFVRQGVDDPPRFRDPKHKGKVPLDARNLLNRGLGQEKNNEPAIAVEGAAQVPVLNHSRDASREGKAEGKCQEGREGRDAAAFVRGGYGEGQEHEKEGKHDGEQGGDKEASEKKENEEDKGDNEDKGGKDGGEDKEDEEDEEDKEEEQVQTEEEQRASLETSVRLLRLVLEDGQMAWRADIHAPCILSAAFVKLADLAKNRRIEPDVLGAMDTPGEGDETIQGASPHGQSMEPLDGAEGRAEDGRGAAGQGQVGVGNSGNSEHPDAGTMPDEASTKAVEVEMPATRQEILDAGEESLETIFEILEKKVSLLLSAWKPLWRAHCNAKGLRARLAGGGADGGRRDTVTSGAAAAKHGLRRRVMGSRLATKRRRPDGGRGGGTSSLGDMVLEMMRSVASAGVDIEAHASPSGSPNVGSGGGRRGGSAEGAGRTNSSGEGTRAEKKARKLPKGLKTQLSQLLKVLGMMTIVLEQRIHLAELAGRSRDHMVTLLQGAITYLCLLRADPPGSPVETGPETTPGHENVDGKPTSHDVKLEEVPEKPADGSDAAPATTTAKSGPAVEPVGSMTSPLASCGLTPAAGKRNSKRAAVLTWDSESLTSLLALHKAMAAALLRPERDAMAEALLQSERDPGNHVTKDGDPECRRRSLRLRSTEEAFKTAEASLATALAAAAAGAGSVSSNNDFVSSAEGNESSTGGERPAPPDATSTPMLQSGDHAWADSRLLEGCRPSPWSIAGGCDGKPRDSFRQTGALSEPEPDPRVTRGGRFLNRSFPVPRQGAVVVSTAGRDTIVELYSMRCTVREGLGALECALRDVQEALVLAPKAPKLWAKAASLALRTGKHAGGGEGGVGGGGGGPRRTEMRRLMEAMRLASGLLQLCPRSLHGFLFRGQAAERVGLYTRALRDYCHAQHACPGSLLPVALRTRLAARLDCDDTGTPHMLHGGRVDNHASDAVNAIGEFVWSPFLSTEEACPQAGTPTVPAEETRSPSTPRVDGTPRLSELTVLWWKGRIKELDRRFPKAIEYFERVYEKAPTIGHVTHLARCYLCAKQPENADDVLSAFLNGTAPTPPVGHSGGGATETPEPSGLRGGNVVPRKFAGGVSREQLLAVRILHGRALFAVGRDKKSKASFNLAMKGGNSRRQASVLYECALSEAISTCIRSSSRESDDDDSDNNDDSSASRGPLSRPDSSGWDPALFDQYSFRTSISRNSTETPSPATSEAVRVVAEEPSRFGGGKDTFGCSDGSPGQHNDERVKSSVAVAPRTRVVSNDGGAGKAAPAAPPSPSLGRNEEMKESATKPRGASSVFDGVADSKRQQGGQPPRDGPTIKQGANGRQGSSFRDHSPSPTNGARVHRRRRQRGGRGIEKSLKLVTRCLQMDALNAKAYALRAELEARLGRRDRAITDFKAAASLEHGGSRSKINQGVTYLHASRFSLASAEFDAIERDSKGPAERVLAAFNLGVAEATAGDLSRAEAAFTRALEGLATRNPHAELKTPVTRGACLVNRGMVRFAMKSFRRAVEDLGGAGADGDGMLKVGSFSVRGEGENDAAVAAACGSMGGRLALDCSLARALAEGRLECKASREASGQSLRKLLRPNHRLLACEVAAVRVGLGNLATTRGGENRADCLAEGAHRPAAFADHGAKTRKNRPRKSQEQLGGEVLCHAPYKGILTEASATLAPKPRRVDCAPGTRGVWAENLGARQTGRAVATAGGKRALRHFLYAIHACPTASAAWLNATEVLETATAFGHGEATTTSSDWTPPARMPHPAPAKTPALALLEAVLSMAPRHPTALRCQATTLARLGHQSSALAQADQAVSAAIEYVRVTEDKSVTGRPPSTASGNGTTIPSPRPDMGTPTLSALTAAGGTSEHAVTATASRNDRDRPRARSPPGSMGFMPGSKATVVVGGLLRTGGGGSDALHIAKSLTLRGCLRQKAGRSKTAEDDYRRALEICHKQLEHLDRCPKRSDDQAGDTAGPGKEGGPESLRTSSHLNSGKRGTGSPENVLGSRGERFSCFEEDGAGYTIEPDASKVEGFSHLLAPPGKQLEQERKDTRGTILITRRPEGALLPSYYRAVLRLESLIHHNLSTLHMAAVLREDAQASSQKEAATREASECIACEQRASTNRRGSYTNRERWWHSNLLAVVQIILTIDGQGHRPWPTASYHLGKNARLHLRSAETAAMASDGYEPPSGQEHTQPALGAWDLVGAARSQALMAIRVNLASAEKIGAMSAHLRGEQRRAGLRRAIDWMTDAISSYGLCPETYIQRGELLARVGAYGIGDGVSSACEAAASDFARALWLDRHIQRRFQLAPKEDKRNRVAGKN